MKDELKTVQEAPEQEAREEKAQEQIAEAVEEIKKKQMETGIVFAEGRGKLKLDTPIRASGQDIEELAYDFRSMTGLEYADAMDSDPKATQTFRITTRQALALFAAAAAKETPRVDAKDILENLSPADALAAAQIATVFFNASTRAASLHISKR